MARLLRAVVLIFALGAVIGSESIALAADKKVFKVGYSVYVGFMPLAWMSQSGMLKKWADKYGIAIEIDQVNDYVGSVNQFIAGDIDAVGMAGMDALTMPAAGGVDSSIFLITDYSNGNDVLLSKDVKSVKELAGQSVYLLQFSVSHYLLDRALVMNGIDKVSSVKTINISDSEVSAAFLTQNEIHTVASWKPMTNDMLKAVAGTQVLFDSSKIPGEIMDVLVAKTATMQEHPEFAKALIGAWYETMQLWKAGGEPAKAMAGIMASAMGTDEGGFQNQVDTTHFFQNAADAAGFLSAASTKATWNNIRTFCFDNGLMGQNAASVDAIGIAFPDDTTLGDTKNVKLRIDPAVTTMASKGQL